MADYQPLDLLAWCNAGVELLGEDQQVCTGRLSLRGLPFIIGGVDGGNCFIALDGAAGAVTIPIGGPARRVIFAHRLLESDVAGGGVPGREVAEYVFRFAGGEALRVPIRERFEIEMVGSGWGTVPFLAVGDQNDRLFPRYEGRWDQLGLRQTEATRGGTSRYSLWAWANPQPDHVIDVIDIVPKGPRFMVAAITLGHLDEHPFVRQGRREVRIDLTESEHADRPFDLNAEVDRGIATYVHALPRASADDFLNDPFKGWGRCRTLAPALPMLRSPPSPRRRSPSPRAEVRWAPLPGATSR